MLTAKVRVGSGFVGLTFLARVRIGISSTDRDMDSILDKA